MSWLIEAFLDEADYATKEYRSRDDVSSIAKADGRGKSGWSAMKGGKYVDPHDPDAEKVIKSRDHDKTKVTGHSSSEWVKAHPEAKDGEVEFSHEKDNKQYKDAKKWANKQLKPGMFKKADPEKVAQAADAKARHDRRHPNRVTNESTDMIVESLQ
jgi:hypothetical protein